MPLNHTATQLSLPLDTKRCCTCKAVKYLNEYNRNAANQDGLQKQCRTCQRASGRKYWADHPEKAKEHYDKNRDAIIARASAWAKANPERHKKHRRTIYLRSQERLRQYREANRERHKAYYAKWRVENRHIRREHDARREARIRSTQVEKVRYDLIIERDGYVCHICGGDVLPDDLQFDHVIPLARGGPHIFDNIRVSHATCNNRKKARLIQEI